MKCLDGKVGHPSVATTLGTILAGETFTHEKNYHQGRPCVDFRAGLLAFMAHILYMDRSNWARIQESLNEHLEKGCSCLDSPRGYLQLMSSHKS